MNKKIFEGLAPLYVNFAMKRSERQEVLVKKKEELYKLSQKMTIYVKIKDGIKLVKNFKKIIFIFIFILFYFIRKEKKNLFLE